MPAPAKWKLGEEGMKPFLDYEAEVMESMGVQDYYLQDWEKWMVEFVDVLESAHYSFDSSATGNSFALEPLRNSKARLIQLVEDVPDDMPKDVWERCKDMVKDTFPSSK